MQRSGAVATEAAEPIRAQVCQSAVVGSDETGARMNGQTWWEWVFRDLRAPLREAIHQLTRRAKLTVRGYARRVSELEQRLNRLIDRPVQMPAAPVLVKRYRQRWEHLFVFIRDPTVPHHNNDCERSLRASVVHRKVIGT